MSVVTILVRDSNTIHWLIFQHVKDAVKSQQYRYIHVYLSRDLNKTYLVCSLRQMDLVDIESLQLWLQLYIAFSVMSL